MDVAYGTVNGGACANESSHVAAYAMRTGLLGPMWRVCGSDVAKPRQPVLGGAPAMSSPALCTTARHVSVRKMTSVTH